MDGSICKQERKANAIGDVVDIDVSRYSVKFLGKVTVDKLVTLALPDTPGEKTVYSFVPAQGDFAGQLVYIVFDYIKPRPGTQIVGKTIVMVYRRIEGTKTTAWTEIANVKLTVPNVKLGSIDVTLKPDGTGVWFDTQEKKNQIFLIGRKDFGTLRAEEAKKVQQAALATEVETKATTTSATGKEAPLAKADKS
jgi:hypothetical protein